MRTAYYIHASELMKLIFAVLDVSLKMGLSLHVVIKQKVFFTFIQNNGVWKSNNISMNL